MLPAAPPAASPALARRPRRTLLLALTGAAAFVLMACFSITGQSTTQKDVIGDLIVTTEMCLGPDLGEEGNGCDEGAQQGSSAMQYFVGYRVPQALPAPRQVAWTGDLGDVTLVSDPTYAEQLAAISPLAEGEKWVGYRTGPMPPVASGQQGRMTATAAFAIAETSPAVVPIATVTGYRELGSDPASAAEAPTVCTSSTPSRSCIYDAYPGFGPSVPTPDGGSTAGPLLAHDYALNTAKLTAPAPADVVAGQRATLQFSVKTTRAGEAPVALPIEATSVLPGAVVEAPLELPLGGEDAPVTVTVDVPADAKPGEYAVTFASQNGLRKATAKLNVAAAPVVQAPPAGSPVPAEPTATPGSLLQTATLLKASIERTPVVAKLRAGQPVSVPVQLPSRGFVRLSVVAVKKYGWQNPPVLAVATGPTSKPGELTMRLRATKQGRKVLKTRKSVKATLVIRLWGRTGKTVSMPVEFSIK